MTKFFKILIAGIFLIYFAITLLYNSPNNYIKIKFEREIKIFDLFFNQRWGFFAPPPTFNNRLYYTFYDENQNEIATFEVLKPLAEQKRKARPFNERDEMIDYMINGSIIGISNQIPIIRDSKKISNPAFSTEKLNTLAINELTNNPDAFSGYAILKNYAKEVAKNSLKKNYNDIRFFKIHITSIPIKKFTDRYSKEPSREYTVINFNLTKFL